MRMPSKTDRCSLLSKNMSNRLHCEVGGSMTLVGVVQILRLAPNDKIATFFSSQPNQALFSPRHVYARVQTAVIKLTSDSHSDFTNKIACYIIRSPTYVYFVLSSGADTLFCRAEQKGRICIFGTKRACGTRRLRTPLFKCVQSKKAVTAV